jgi:hypothetical protein
LFSVLVNVLIDNVLLTPSGLLCPVYGANLHLFHYEFEIFKHLLKKTNTWPVVLGRLSHVHRFVDDLVPNFSGFESFMYLDKD